MGFVDEPSMEGSTTTWTYRGNAASLPRDALLATLDLALLQAGCAALAISEEPRALFDLESGRQVLITARLVEVPRGFGVEFVIEADERDAIEIDEIHERICSLVPAMAQAVEHHLEQEAA